MDRRMPQCAESAIDARERGERLDDAALTFIEHMR
jgi:hypothetical protein